MTTALLGALVTICVAGTALLGVLYGHLSTRLTHLEGVNRSLWVAYRGLRDLYYRHRHPDAPDPPPLPDDI